EHAEHPHEAVRMPYLPSAGHAQLAPCDVLDEEGERRGEQGSPPLDPYAVWPDAATRLRSARNEIAERDDVGVEVVGEQGEVGGSTLFGRDLPPAVVLPALRVAEADELDVRAVGSDDQRVVRHAVGVDAAGNDVEAAPGRIGPCELGVEVAVDLDDVVEHPQHAFRSSTALSSARGATGGRPAGCRARRGV